jgi:hypothetical protein
MAVEQAGGGDETYRVLRVVEVAQRGLPEK